MSIRMAPKTARLTVLGKGWNDNTVIESGDGFAIDEGVWGEDNEIWGGDDDIWYGDDVFRFTVRTSYNSRYVSFRYRGRIKVNWGDGTIDDRNAPSSGSEVNSYTTATHRYAETSADYAISIAGDLQGISFKAIAASSDYPKTEFGRVTAVLTPFPATMRDVVDFSKVFLENSDLTSIPADLFDNCPNVTNFSYVFCNCRKLTSIPAGLFDNCPNVTNFTSAFSGDNNLTDIPDGLFDNCPNVTNFCGVFFDCSNRTTIPDGLFDNCPNVTNFTSAFESCDNLTTIPDGLFDNCPNVTNFYCVFCNCRKLTSIPAGLFDNCPNVTNFSYAFSGGNKIDSALPELWNTHPGAYGWRCFTGCYDAANYESVPEAWK